ncbi:hypothetical protein VKT23_017741 [Stygiomarasmius scandens]|uniref:Uncharacterized protein n=1 Tax=Marasmiellus scandens TaxID=2682957 RepID=A0ABR1IRE7_9AGAR
MPSYANRLRILFLIAMSNFVFPIIFVILELSLINKTSNEKLLAGVNISATNVEVVGVLFATLWASQEVDIRRKEQQTDIDPRTGGALTNEVSLATRPATFVSTRLTDEAEASYRGGQSSIRRCNT